MAAVSKVSERNNRMVLVTGGAGYIGSHTVLALRDEGYNTIVFDDLSTGQRDLLPVDLPFVV